MPREQKKRPGFFQKLFGTTETTDPRTLAAHDSVVTPDPIRCIQCGVCGYNCPVGIPVRDYACRGKIVDHPDCVQCGQCIEACPRGTLRWDKRPGARPNGPAATEYAEVMSLFAETSSGKGS